MKKQKINLFWFAVPFVLIFQCCEKGLVSITEAPTPQGFRVDTITAGKLLFTWDKVNPSADSIHLLRQNGLAKKELIASLKNDEQRFVDGTFTQDTIKNIKYILQTIIGDTYSEAEVVNFKPFAPAMPYNQTATFVSLDNVTLTWQCDTRFADGIIVQYWDSLAIFQRLSREQNSFVVPVASVQPTSYRIYSYAREINSNYAIASYEGLVPIVGNLNGYKTFDNKAYVISWDDKSLWEDGYYVWKGISSTDLMPYDTLPPNTESYVDSVVYFYNQVNFSVFGFKGDQLSKAAFLTID